MTAVEVHGSPRSSISRIKGRLGRRPDRRRSGADCFIVRRSLKQIGGATKSLSPTDEKPMKTMSGISPARWTREGQAMKKFILSAMLALTLMTGAVVATSIVSQPAYAGCGCQP
jgi:hypothetical protein